MLYPAYHPQLISTPVMSLTCALFYKGHAWEKNRTKLLAMALPMLEGDCEIHQLIVFPYASCKSGTSKCCPHFYLDNSKLPCQCTQLSTMQAWHT